MKYMPNRKVMSGLTIGGAAAIIASWAIKEFAGVEMPAEVSAALGALLNFVVAYFVSDGGRDEV